MTTDGEVESYKKIGTGGFGTVFALRDARTKKPVDRILKTSPLRTNFSIITFSREVLYLQELHRFQWRRKRAKQWKPLAPRLYLKQIQSSTAADRATKPEGKQTMEQMDGTMTQLGLKQAQKFGLKSGVAYTAAQILEMVDLQLILDSLHLVHGDLKRRNLLYKMFGGGTLYIFLSDFGYSGFEHAGDKSIKSEPSGGRRRPPHSAVSLSSTPYDFLLRPQIGFPNLAMRKAFPEHLWPYLNRWQLYFDFLYNRPTYLIRDGKLDAKPLGAAVLRALFDLPIEIIREFIDLFGLYSHNRNLPSALLLDTIRGVEEEEKFISAA